MQNLRNYPGKMSIFMALKGAIFGFYGTKSIRKNYNIGKNCTIRGGWQGGIFCQIHHFLVFLNHFLSVSSVFRQNRHFCVIYDRGVLREIRGITTFYKHTQ